MLLALGGYHLFGIVWLDPIASLLVSVYILKSTWHLFRGSFDNLMDKELSDEERDRIGQLILGVTGALGFHDLRTRRSGARRFVDVHLEIDRTVSFVDAHRIAEEVTLAVEQGVKSTRIIVHADPWPPDPDDEPLPFRDEESSSISEAPGNREAP